MNEEVLANNLKKMLDTTTPPEPPKLVTNLVDCMTAVEVTGLMLYCSALIGQRATAELVCHMAKRKQIDLSVIRAFEDAGVRVKMRARPEAPAAPIPTPPKTKTGAKVIKGKPSRRGNGWGGKKGPVWLKQVDSIDKTQNGMDAIDGSWLSDPTSMDDMTDINKPVLMGVRYPDKHYAVLIYKKGATANLKCQTSIHEVKDAKLLDDSSLFKSMLPVLDKNLS